MHLLIVLGVITMYALAATAVVLLILYLVRRFSSPSSVTGSDRSRSVWLVLNPEGTPSPVVSAHPTLDAATQACDRLATEYPELTFEIGRYPLSDARLHAKPGLDGVRNTGPR